MTIHEVDCDVIASMPPQNRLPVLTDHENAEMYKKVCKAVRDYKAGKPPAKRVPIGDIPKILEDLREQLREQELTEEQTGDQE